jgi:hypothetical protein
MFAPAVDTVTAIAPEVEAVGSWHPELKMIENPRRIAVKSQIPEPRPVASAANARCDRNGTSVSDRAACKPVVFDAATSMTPAFCCERAAGEAVSDREATPEAIVQAGFDAAAPQHVAGNKLDPQPAEAIHVVLHVAAGY